MNASRMTLIPLICILAVNLAAGAIDLTATGTSTAIGNAIVQGDVFRSEPYVDTLYSGLWAHVYIPSGNDGVNAGDSERTVQARTEVVKLENTVNKYELTNDYGDSTVIAKASKTGVLGEAEAFSEVSALSRGLDIAGSDWGLVGGYAQLATYISHSGTGTANALADGSSGYSAMSENGVIQASGSVSGSAALDAENNYGGSTVGTALKVTQSSMESFMLSPISILWAYSGSYDYLSLESGRNALSAKSIIDGRMSGEGSASVFGKVTGTPDYYGISQSSSKGDLYATAATYKLGDSITPSEATTEPRSVYYSDSYTQLDNEIGTGNTGRTTGLYSSIFFERPKASAYLISQNEVDNLAIPPLSTGYSLAQSESFTSASVTRTLADATEAYGASYIDNGALSAMAYTSSEPGTSPLVFTTADASDISMGSGAHLISHLTGATPASTADLVVESEMYPDASYVRVAGDAQKMLVNTVGPSYSPSGISADATGSYLTAEKISGTAVNVADPLLNIDPQLIADDIDCINIWSWISGDDPRSHAESSTGLVPFVSTPVYTSDPIGAVGVTEGPTTTSGATATTRSVDVVFESHIIH